MGPFILSGTLNTGEPTLCYGGEREKRTGKIWCDWQARGFGIQEVFQGGALRHEALKVVVFVFRVCASACARCRVDSIGQQQARQ